MAVGLRGLFRLNLGLAKSLVSKSNFINVSVRTLYVDRDLGIHTYENTRFVFRNQFVSIEDTFRVKMREICNKEDGVIFTEDLKAMIHLAQSNEEDLQLVTEMLKKFINFKNNVQFGSYVFGPVLMRMLYYLNEPQKALDIFKNPELTETFMFHSAIRILLCLLYKHQMYQDIRDVIDIAEKLKGKEFITSTIIIAYAGCFKENTPEAAEYAIRSWKEHCKIRIPTSRATGIVSHIAIRHNSPEEALEMLSVAHRDGSIVIRCLKVLAYTQLGRYLQIIPILKYSTEQDLSVPHKFGFYADVICELEEKLKDDGASERDEIMYLISKLRQQQRIESEKTLEEHLLRPLQFRTNQREDLNDRRSHMNRPRDEFKVGLKNYL